MAQICELVIIAADAEWLTQFCRSLVESGYCAHAQISDPVKAIYRQDGDVIERTEVRAALHLPADRVQDVAERLEIEKPEFSYPVFSFLISGGTDEYHEYIIDETRNSNGGFFYPAP